jgi:hypothetical protein
VSVADRLAPVRAGRYADLALFVAVAVGLATTWVHWAGLVVGGALVGLVSTSVPRALAVGVTFGGVVLVTFAAWNAYQGTLFVWLSLGQVLVATVAAAMAVPPIAAVAVRAIG